MNCEIVLGLDDVLHKGVLQNISERFKKAEICGSFRFIIIKNKIKNRIGFYCSTDDD